MSTTSSASSNTSARTAEPPGGVDRRESLVAAARTVIAEQGFAGLRTRDVAGRAGINHATLHHYFPTKAALIEAVVRDLVSQLATYRSSQRAGDVPPRTALHAYLAASRAHVVADPTPFMALREFIHGAGRTPHFATILRELDEGWNGFLRGLIVRGQREGDFRKDLEPRDVARIITTYMSGVQMPVRDGGVALAREHAQLEKWITVDDPTPRSARRRR